MARKYDRYRELDYRWLVIVVLGNVEESGAIHIIARIKIKSKQLLYINEAKPRGDLAKAKSVYSTPSSIDSIALVAPRPLSSLLYQIPMSKFTHF
jgi:hypothetical protein